MNCLMKAWSQNESFLKSWLLARTGNPELAEDLLQDVFLKALKNKEQFCQISHARSWLLAIARNTTVDVYRKAGREVEMTFEPEQPVDEQPSEILKLQRCMQRVLGELETKDQEAIQFCDIQGISQKEYARKSGLTLVAAKSRVQRARKKLREQMIAKCQIRFDQHGICGFTPRPENNL